MARTWSFAALALAAVASLGTHETNAATLGSLSDADSTFGPNTVTRDASRNIEFLDLNLTSGYSYATLLPQLASGGAFQGFFLASTSLFNTLVADSGILPLTGSAAQSGFDALLGLLNPTAVEDIGGFGCVLALTAATSTGGAAAGSRDVPNVVLDRQPNGTQPGCGPVLAGSEFITQTSTAFIDDLTTVNDHNASNPVAVGGFLLARGFRTNVVPEPGAAGLIAAALVLVAIIRRRASGQRRG